MKADWLSAAKSGIHWASRSLDAATRPMPEKHLERPIPG